MKNLDLRLEMMFTISCNMMTKKSSLTEVTSFAICVF